MVAALRVVTAMEFDILGPFRVSTADGALELGSPAQRGLLAVLLTKPNVLVSADRLVDELWGDVPPPSAHHLVQVYVSRLRALLGDLPDGPRIVHDGPGYTIRLTPEELDAERFAALAIRAREVTDRDPRSAADAFAAAMRLWRGAPFADLSPLPPAVRDRAVSLERDHQEATEEWIDVRLRLGQHRELIPMLADRAAEQPYDEPAHAQLMLAHYRSGHQADALETARTLRSRLREDLGIDPAPLVTDLYRDILLQAAHLELHQAAPPCNLPTGLSSFVGREREQRVVAQLLSDARLVTLTGPGGIGKTRLAIEVAQTLRLQFAGGVWWIDLGHVTEPGIVQEEIAQAVGLSPSPGVPLDGAVTRALNRREALLVIDNCEHLAAAIGASVAAILQATSRPRVLATSRIPLGVEGEQLWLVPPLGLPVEGQAMSAVGDSDAVRLFVDRGRATRRSFALGTDNVSAVVEICRRLDGLSLAIEMAAARLAVLSPREIADRLDDRLSLLALPTADGLTRHRTMRAALDASYLLLSELERGVFERLAVFVGPFDLEAAAAVGSAGGTSTEVLAAVDTLVEGSLLTAQQELDQSRYRMLETVREYALARLRERGSEHEARRAHAEHYIGLAERAGAKLGTPDFTAWMERLGQAIAELRHALIWSLDGQPRATTLRAAPALREYWFRRGDARDALRWTGRMLDGDLGVVPPDLLADACSAAAFASHLSGDVAAATRLIDRSLSLARAGGRPESLAFALFGAAQVAFGLGDLDRVRANALEAVAVCDRAGERWARAGSLASLGFATLAGGGPVTEGRAWLDQALVLYRELGDIGSLVLTVLGPLTITAIIQGDLDSAEEYATEALELASGGWRASALACYAQVLIATGDVDGAEGAASSALRLALDSGLENWFRIALRVAAGVAADRRRFEDAAVLVGGSRHSLPPYGLVPGMTGPLELRCRESVGDDRFEVLAADGEALGDDELLRLASPSGVSGRPGYTARAFPD